MSTTINQTAPPQAGPMPVQQTKCPWCKDVVPSSKVQQHKNICPNRPRPLKDRN